jgi:hypothetical protein
MSLRCSGDDPIVSPISGAGASQSFRRRKAGADATPSPRLRGEGRGEGACRKQSFEVGARPRGPLIPTFSPRGGEKEQPGRAAQTFSLPERVFRSGWHDPQCQTASPVWPEHVLLVSFLFFSVLPAKKKRRQNAGRRNLATSAPLRVRRCSNREQHAYRRSTAALTRGVFHPKAQPGPGFLGRGRSARSMKSPCGEEPRAAPLAYATAAPVPVQGAPPIPVVVPGDVMPELPGSRPYPPARGHRTRSDFRNTFAKGVLR